MSRFPRHSGSLIILRDEKVLMLKRNPNVTFREVHTFPGGRLEDTDKKLANIHRNEIDAAHRSFYNEEWYPAALIAALRETYEETGLVFAPADTPPEGYLLPPTHLKPLIRFVTPYQGKARFDTQFFVVTIDEYTAAYNLNNKDNWHDIDDLQIDKNENSEYLWDTPTNILKKYLQGDIRLLPPTIYILLLIKKVKQIKQFVDLQNQNRYNWVTFPIIFDIKTANQNSQSANLFYANEVFYGDDQYDIKKMIKHEISPDLIKFLEKLPQPQKGGRLRSHVTYTKQFRLIDFRIEASAEFKFHPIGILSGEHIKNSNLVEPKPKL